MTVTYEFSPPVGLTYGFNETTITAMAAWKIAQDLGDGALRVECLDHHGESFVIEVA